MAFHGRVACRLATGKDTKVIAGYLFSSLYATFKSCEALGLCAEVANNYGNGSGFNPPDDAIGPVGTSGTFVFRLPPTSKRAYSLYVICHYAQTAALSVNAKLNNGAITSYGGVGVTFAAALNSGGADVSPLNKASGTQWTTNMAGADVKGNPTCALPSGGKLWLGDRSNSQSDGGNKVAMDNLHLLYNGNNSTTHASRWSLVMDADNVMFAMDIGDDGQPIVIAAVMLERDSAAAAVCPFGHAVLRYDCQQLPNGIQGATAGTGTIEFTVPFTTAGDARRAAISGYVTGAGLSTYQPNSLTARYADGPLEFAVADGTAVGIAGTVERYTLGEGEAAVSVPVVGITSNVNNYDTLAVTAAMQRVVFGSATQAHAKLTFPWDGATQPQDPMTTELGVEF